MMSTSTKVVPLVLFNINIQVQGIAPIYVYIVTYLLLLEIVLQWAAKKTRY
jgi:hypothetical protein